MFTGEVGVLVSLARLFSTVTQGPQAGRRDAITGLEYHATQPPPAAAASECMHWVSDPQVGLPGSWDLGILGSCFACAASTPGHRLPP